MGCPCSGGGGSTGGEIIYPPITHTQIVDCGLNRSILNTWMTALICIKLQDKFTQAGIGLVATNQMLGIIQSGLNYPDNYCYFYEQLEYFKDNLLPQIVANVPECFS